MRITAFVATTRRGRPADLKLRHRRRARAEERRRAAKDTGLGTLPPPDFASNQLCCALLALAADLLAWMQTPALSGPEARRWAPQRLRLFSVPARHPGPAAAGCHTGPPAPRSPRSPLQALDALAQLTAPALADTG